jgi:hypothetical protein
LDFPLAQAITIRVTTQAIITALVIITTGHTTTVLGTITPIDTDIITIAGTIGVDQEWLSLASWRDVPLPGVEALIKCVNGLEPFQKGEIVIEGTSVGVKKKATSQSCVRAQERCSSTLSYFSTRITRKSLFSFSLRASASVCFC